MEGRILARLATEVHPSRCFCQFKGMSLTPPFPMCSDRSRSVFAGLATAKIRPAQRLEVVELAAVGCMEIPAPRELLDDDATRQCVLEQRLGALELVQRDAHVHVVGRVLHDV